MGLILLFKNIIHIWSKFTDDSVGSPNILSLTFSFIIFVITTILIFGLCGCSNELFIKLTRGDLEFVPQTKK